MTHLRISLSTQRLIRTSFGSFKRLSNAPFFPHQTHETSGFSSHHPTTEDPHERFDSREQTLLSLFDSREQSLLSLFDSCSTMRDLKQIHAQIIRTGFEQHVFVAGRIITFCSFYEQGSIDHASSLFELIQWPDGFLYNTMIRGFGRASRAEDAFSLYKRMRQNGKPADNFTFCFLIKISGETALVDLGKQLHACVSKHGLHTHMFVRNTILHMYALFKDMKTARKVFDEIPSRDLVCWNTLIKGYVHCGECGEALEMFRLMRRSGFEPDEATLVVVLSACTELGELDFGRRVHSKIRNFVLDRSVSISNSLIDMYAKCGAINVALKVFEGMKERNVVSWNSIILGFAMHGHCEEAMRLFDRMREEEFGDPNDITFLGLLCACSHGGLVEEGRRYFDSMRSDYGITPAIKHYGCMVDMLGRAGLVREAYELTKSMPMAGNAVVWRTLLGACRVHGDLELGERVRMHLEELDPDHSSDYVLLSHMYASVGRWGDVLYVREVMRGRGVQKPEAGNSLINMLPSAIG